ncbi:MAG: signal peptide peptidase SppA [Planctomycetales bacterium]|nr:signal peptide peptidase SppA [Planctomycetales bacterium]
MDNVPPEQPNSSQGDSPPSSAQKAAIGTLLEGQPVQVVLVHSPQVSLRRWMMWLGWTLFAVTLVALLGLRRVHTNFFDTSHGLTESYVSGSTDSGAEKIAILSVSGVIADGSGYVKKQIDRIRKDKNVKAVVVRVVSPGGTVTGSDYIYHHLTQLREQREIPIVVSMGSVAASGGYYVAMAVGDQEKSIYAEPTTTTGSIGVIIPHYDVSGFMEDHNLKDDSIATHPRKRMLSMTKPITDDDRAVLDEYLEAAFDRFKGVIKSGRPAFRDDPAKLDELATGEVFAAEKAKRVGLVDELGFIEDAIDRAAELAGLDTDKAQVVRYAAPVTVADMLGIPGVRSSSVDVATLFELSTPQAYYLASTRPAIISTFRFDDYSRLSIPSLEKSR